MAGADLNFSTATAFQNLNGYKKLTAQTFLNKGFKLFKQIFFFRPFLAIMG